MRVPVLTYHAFNIAGNDYASNDHVAFAVDLAAITALGWKVAPLHRIVDALIDGTHALPAKTLAITFDDATDFDFHDLPHPQFGVQRSMLNIMRDFMAENPRAQPDLHATSFVIASPEARATMDRLRLFEKQWMNDGWWREAVATGLMGIANHSWDHTNEVLDIVAQRNQEKGNFFCIDTQADADAQIREAARFIAGKAPNDSVSLFGYPYGHVNEFLPQEYFPRQARLPAPFVRAAFGTQAGMITPECDRWNLPRYVCGWHWKYADGLAAILEG
jgi:peptidoglycan/xylan/chitin deacetylase (PgdA/CDA1 family)